MLARRLNRRFALWGVIIAAPLAWLSGWAAATHDLASPVIILGIGLTALLLMATQGRRAHYPLVGAFFVPTFLYAGIWLRYRVWIQGIPINIIDILVALTGLSACLFLIRNRNQGLSQHNASLAGVVLAFLGVNLIGGLQGLICNYPLYDVVQHTSFSIYLVIIYFSTLVLIHTDGQIELLIKTLLIGALIAGIEQILYFLVPSLGASPALNRVGFYRALPSQLTPENLSRLPASSAIQFYRTALIPSGYILRAVVLLVSGMLVGSNSLSRLKSYVLLSLYMLAILLTYSRGLWASTIVSLVALFVIAGGQRGRRARVAGKTLVALAMCLFVFLVLNALLPTPVDFVEAAAERMSHVAQIPKALLSSEVTEGIGLAGRLLFARQSLEVMSEGNLFTLLLGRGHGFQGGGAKAHGSFAFYLSRVGTVGLGILLSMLLLGAKRGLEIQRRASSASHKMIAMGLVVVLVVYGGISGLGSGPFSSAANMPFWGVSFALLDIIGSDCNQARGR